MLACHLAESARNGDGSTNKIGNTSEINEAVSASFSRLNPAGEIFRSDCSAVENPCVKSRFTSSDRTVGFDVTSTVGVTVISCVSVGFVTSG